MGDITLTGLISHYGVDLLVSTGDGDSEVSWRFEGPGGIYEASSGWTYDGNEYMVWSRDGVRCLDAKTWAQAKLLAKNLAAGRQEWPS